MNIIVRNGVLHVHLTKKNVETPAHIMKIARKLNLHSLHHYRILLIDISRHLSPLSSLFDHLSMSVLVKLSARRHPSCQAENRNFVNHRNSVWVYRDCTEQDVVVEQGANTILQVSGACGGWLRKNCRQAIWILRAARVLYFDIYRQDVLAHVMN
jgi:hypothetical protein